MTFKIRNGSTEIDFHTAINQIISEYEEKQPSQFSLIFIQPEKNNEKCSTCGAELTTKNNDNDSLCTICFLKKNAIPEVKLG